MGPRPQQAPHQEALSTAIAGAGSRLSISCHQEMQIKAWSHSMHAHEDGQGPEHGQHQTLVGKGATRTLTYQQRHRHRVLQLCHLSGKWTHSYHVIPQLLSLVPTQRSSKLMSPLKPVHSHKHWNVETTIMLSRKSLDFSTMVNPGRRNVSWNEETQKIWTHTAKWKKPVWKVFRVWFQL